MKEAKKSSCRRPCLNAWKADVEVCARLEGEVRIPFVDRRCST